jgi:fatty acid desaturase
MTARSPAVTTKGLPPRRPTVTAKEDFRRRAWTTALLVVALLAALIFGAIVLAGGDWIPGAIIVVASLIGLARQIPIIARLCSEAPPSSRRRTPTG